MVDFFIRRPIFATVSALLMLLIGGICAFLSCRSRSIPRSRRPRSR